MTTQRSFRNAAAGQQLYAIVESCRRLQQLWDKLATGNYDWLGARSNGRYLLGRPRLSAVVDHGDPPVDQDDLDPHRVEIRGPLDRGVQHERYPTVAEAREAYERLIAGDPVTRCAARGCGRCGSCSTRSPRRKGSWCGRWPRVV